MQMKNFTCIFWGGGGVVVEWGIYGVYTNIHIIYIHYMYISIYARDIGAYMLYIHLG